MGVVHGLAGSGAIVVTLVATVPTVASSLSFLGAFTLVTVLTMAVLSRLWGSVLTTRARRTLKRFAGVASVVVGVNLILAETVGIGLLPI